ncbi:PKD domain-containing protein [Ghiorsea bivora]|uniref:PKD domain-containing protein n=1 Tax=Ghiorsea bivora TaxID=1485545 RepID=UPI000571F161|nr:PKD domain-containing protein [Ghiorsea bivora]
MKFFNICLVATIIMVGVSFAQARVLPGWFDSQGNPVHTADEVNVQVNVTVQATPQGYRYTYSITSLPNSLQNLVVFEVALSDPYSVVAGTEASPWPHSQGTYFGNPKHPSTLGYQPSLETLSILWSNRFSTFSPGLTLSGFMFISPYPPAMISGRIEGDTEPPVIWDEEQDIPEFYNQTIYGPGKIIPVIGPVKPTTPNVTDNYSVLGCVGGICDVQLDITGPQDPYGTAYTYTWSGAFGTAMGAKPVVQLAAGTYQVSVAVSDPYATLVTATMPITVVDPNPPAGGGNAGGAGSPSNDMDHDGIDDEHDDDRDGDGKPNNEDDDPDHPD